MCTYRTEHAEISGSGKGAGGWFALTRATVYFDHPYHAPLEHTVNIDFTSDAAGSGGRLAVELSPESARALVACVEAALSATG
jgi:hypothetical protein